MKINSILLILIINVSICIHSENGFSETAMIVERSFKSSSISRYLEYIKSTNDRTMPINPINTSNQKTSDYIFHSYAEHIFHQITLDNTESAPIDLILYSDVPLTMLKVRPLYSNSEVLLGGKINERIQNPNSTISAVQISAPPGKSSYEIETSNSSNMGPAKLMLSTIREFKITEKENIIYISLIFGAVISLFLYNIFLLAVNPSKLMIYFSLCCFSTGLFESVLSGAHSVLPMYLYNICGRLWPLYCTLGTSGFSLFLSEISANDRRIFIKKWTLIANIMGNSISFLAIIFQENMTYFSIITLIFLIVVAQSWTPIILGKYKFKEYMLVLAANLLVITTFISILQFTSIINSEYSTLRIQLVTSVVFLLSLSIYTGNRTHQDRLSKIKLQEMITLGRSVQDLLLPRKLAENYIDLSYSFAYEPFEENMSGDWIKHWQTTDGSHHFLLGDVTGKGPQAALAVSIISTIVDRCMRQNTNAKVALIQINKTLHSMLAGKIGSTASGLTVDALQGLTLYNTGGLGWFVQNHQTTKHILGRGSILGQKAYLDISEVTCAPHEWDVMFTFTDGMCNGPRALKHLANRIFSLQSTNESSHNLKMAALGISKSIGDPYDDKAFLVIKLNEALAS